MLFHEPPDVDRYIIDGHDPGRCCFPPRELNIAQLQATQSNWINLHLVLHAWLWSGDGGGWSKTRRIGQPVYLIKDMPAVISYA